MEFEWDNKKATKNLNKHEISFQEAASVAPPGSRLHRESALLKTFAKTGVERFVAPVAVEIESRHQYGAESIGRIDAVREQFFADSPQ